MHKNLKKKSTSKKSKGSLQPRLIGTKKEENADWIRKCTPFFRRLEKEEKRRQKLPVKEILRKVRRKEERDQKLTAAKKAKRNQCQQWNFTLEYRRIVQQEKQRQF